MDDEERLSSSAAGRSTQLIRAICFATQSETTPCAIAESNELSALDCTVIPAEHIEDLLAPPGNRLEMLKGDLANCWSIAINDQFRIVFRWDKGSPNPSEVEIRDYH
jgi:antitoxin HigA-1